MTERELAVVEAPSRALTASDVRAHVNLIQQVMAAVMKEGTHYGTIPGCKQPSLYKAGSEVLLTTFRIAVDPEVEDLSTPDEIRYRVRCKGVHQTSGIVLGTGIGECSSSEEKYKWRRAVCEEEFEQTPENRRRIRYRAGKSGTWTEKQIRTEPADNANTVLKMAKKRAQIDMTLTATGASDIFTQDVEDMPEELRQEEGGEARGQSPGVAAGERAQAAGDPERRARVVADLEAIAQEGWPALQKAWAEMAEEARALVGVEFGRIKKLAEARKRG